MQYYGTRLSENISKREPEGYLLCLNVPVARTGTQDYLPQELGLPPGPEPLPVYRPEEEVFAPETIASFEGMPVTNDHPPDGVDVENNRRLQMGHAHNIRRGAGDESDLLLADLIITDQRLIDAILDGKREISCGYNYELAEENGRYIQRRIRGNHIAVVDAGRAGRRVCIRDHQSTDAGAPARARIPPEPSPFVSMKHTNPDERSKWKMKKTLSRWLARMAKDGDVEQVAEIIEEILGSEPAAPVAEEAAEVVAEAVAEAAEETPAEPVIVENPESATVLIDEASAAGIIERLDRLIELLSPAAAAPVDPAVDETVGEEPQPEAVPAESGPVEEIAEAVEEAVEAAAAAEETAGAPSAEEEIAAIVEEILDPALSVTLEETEDDCSDPDPARSADALRAALKTVRPVLAGMSPKQRSKACADIAARLKAKKVTGGDNAYDLIRRGARKTNENSRDLGEKIMASRNSNYRK